MLNKLWMLVCQKIADYYFYRGYRKNFLTIEGNKDLNKYHDWIDIKLMFKKDED